MLNKIEMFSISPNLKTEFLKIPSKSEIKTKFTNRVRYPNLFFYLILHNKIHVEGEKTQNAHICKVGRYREEYKEGKLAKFTWLSENCILSSCSYF